MEKDVILTRKFVIRNGELEPHVVVNEMANVISKGFHYDIESARKEYYSYSPTIRHIKAIWCVTKSRNNGITASIVESDFE